MLHRQNNTAWAWLGEENFAVVISRWEITRASLCITLIALGLPRTPLPACGKAETASLLPVTAFTPLHSS